MQQDLLLIVDDQLGVRKLLYEVFKDDYLVEEASSGFEALEKLKTITPSLILLDMNMPGMNGLQTFQKIKDEKIDVPVMMITASGESELLQQAENMGIKSYLSKPFDVEKARLLVKEYMNK